MRAILLLSILGCLAAIAPAAAQDTAPLRFVEEYVDEFAAIEHIRSGEEQALKAPDANMLSICLDSSNRYRREIEQQISRMNAIRLPAPSQALPGTIAALYARKLRLYQEVLAACTALKGKSEGDVNSLEVMAAVARYNARLDAVDRELFHTTSAVFWTLLQQRSETREHPSRLVITEAEKASLLRDIERGFGAQLQDDQQTYLVNAGSVLQDYLKSHKASDQP